MLTKYNVGAKLTPQRAYLQANFTRTSRYCGEPSVLELLQVKMFFCYGTYSPFQQIISPRQVRMRPSRLSRGPGPQPDA